MNAVVVAEDPALDAVGWLQRAQAIERDNERVRELRWGPRTLDIDVVCCVEGGEEVIADTPVLTLPHPLAHQRAFVLAPWLEVEPDAELNVGGFRRPVRAIFDELDAVERDGVRLTDLRLYGGEGAR